MSAIISLLQAAICFGTVIMFGSLGETLTGSYAGRLAEESQDE